MAELRRGGGGGLLGKEKPQVLLSLKNLKALGTNKQKLATKEHTLQNVFWESQIIELYPKYDLKYYSLNKSNSAK